MMDSAPQRLPGADEKRSLHRVEKPLVRLTQGWSDSSFWMLAVSVFLVAAGALHKLGAQSLFWLLLYGFTAAVLIVDVDRCVRVSMRVWWIWLLPVLAMFSVFWSIEAQATLKMALVFMYTTIMAIVIGLRLPPLKIFSALVAAAGLAFLASLVVNVAAPVWAGAIDNPEQAVGVFLSKNVYGRSLFLLALAVMVVGYAKRRFVLATGVALLLGWPMLQAESMASLLMYGLVMTFPLSYMLLVGTTRRIKWLVLSLLGAGIILAAFVPVALDLPLVASALDALGKDQTLTGRTELWHAGWLVFSDAPVLGVGFEAFWNAEGLDIKDQLLSLHGELITGFHNLYLETLVGNGLLGIALVFVFMVMSGFLLARWFHIEHTAESLGGLYVWGLLLVMGMVEIVGFRGNSIFHILLVALLVSVAVKLPLNKKTDGVDPVKN